MLRLPGLCEPLVVRGDVRHSKKEKRYYALGQTNAGRCLFVAFTVRRKAIRIISVRNMNQRERESYAQHEKPIPKFRTEQAERAFWASHDSTDFIDWQAAQRRRFPNLKPSLRTISLRLPVAMIEDLKVLANRRDVPYQSLLKVFLAERPEMERRRG
jgi:predicted DNA binding CopG/RHH family protein